MTAALAFAAGVALAWLCLRADTRQPPQPSPARRSGRLDPTSEWTDLPDLPLLDWLPVPAAADHLAAWDAEVDGLPWGSAATWAPIDVRTHIDDQGATVHRIVPERPSTAMVRRVAA